MVGSPPGPGARGCQWRSGCERTLFIPVCQVCFSTQWVCRAWWSDSDTLTVFITVFIGLLSPHLPLIWDSEVREGKGINCASGTLTSVSNQMKRRKLQSYMGKAYFSVFFRHTWGEGSIQGENQSKRYFQWGLWCKGASTERSTPDHWIHAVKSCLPF